MTIKTGTRSPWIEFEGEISELDRGDRLVYLRPGHTVEEEVDYLVEALRADGVVENLAAAYRRVESAEYVVGYFGVTDSGDAIECDQAGETADGELVTPMSCVYAVV